MNDYNKLLTNFEMLKLDKMKDYYPNYVDTATKNNKSLTEALLDLTNKEIEYRNERASQIQITVSAFPYKKEIKDFDFDYQPSINKQEIAELNNLGFLTKHENILFVGPSGVGKTPLGNFHRYNSSKEKIFSIFYKLS